jgi:hypothetical protein
MQRLLDLLVVGSRGYDPIGRLIEGRSSVVDALAGAADASRWSEDGP